MVLGRQAAPPISRTREKEGTATTVTAGRTDGTSACRLTRRRRMVSRTRGMPLFYHSSPPASSRTRKHLPSAPATSSNCQVTVRVISPPRSEWDSLRRPLTAGEREVYEFFDKHLEPEWEMYVQPHLNGLRPDIVLLNPAIGVAVFEVKDWQLAKSDYRFLSSTEVEVRLQSGEIKRDRNPLDQVKMYEREIRDLYSPRLKRTSGLDVLTAGVIFTRAIKSDGLRLVSSSPMEAAADKAHPISGEDDLATANLDAIFPALTSRERDPIAPEVVEDLLAWLVEPRYSADMRRAIKLDSRQELLAGSRPSRGFRRIRGPAGSGKTIVLASRAARLQEEERSRDILFVTFNITLLNFLADILARSGARSTEVTRLNFHGWAKRVLDEVGWREEYDDLWRMVRDADNGVTKREVLNSLIPGMVSKAFADPTRRDRTGHYDAIFVDEGQDLRPEWWQALTKALKPGGEMVLAADFGQSLYSKEPAWTESAMSGAGFAGQWAELKTSYRVPEKLRRLLDEFQRENAGGSYLPLAPSAQTQLDTCDLTWHACVREDVVGDAVKAVQDLLKRATKLSSGASDVTVITTSKTIGSQIETQLRTVAGYRIRSTFKRGDKEDRELKLQFGRGREKSNRISITTVHSFKGFETPLAVVVLTSGNTRAAYAALSRLGGDTDGMSLIVVCSNDKLNAWGKSWPRPTRTI
jgi:hypothetical protein